MNSTSSNDLLIGETSQISRYMSSGLRRISSRNICDEVYETEWDSVYIAFAEQRTRLSEDIRFKEDFFRVNVDMTLEVVRKIRSKRIVYFSTTELWNNCEGQIDLDTPYNFRQNYYTDSKFLTTSKLSELENVVILYPFNFNSVYRSQDYLFGKVFHSILNLERIELGNLDMRRDILHAKWVAEVSSQALTSQIVGSGTCFSVRKYIHDVYSRCGLDPQQYIVESDQMNRHANTLYLKSSKILYSYEKLMGDTIDDIQGTSSKRHNL